MFNASSLYQTEQTIYTYDGLTLYYPLAWFLPGDCLCRLHCFALKRSIQSAFNSPIFTDYDDNFELMVEILPTWIKG